MAGNDVQFPAGAAQGQAPPVQAPPDPGPQVLVQQAQPPQATGVADVQAAPRGQVEGQNVQQAAPLQHDELEVKLSYVMCVFFC
jgi:hypothetical protein